MIRIFAGSHRQAVHVAKQMGLNRSEWEYVSGPDMIRGLPRGSLILYYGTTYNRKDFNEIALICHTREYREMSVPERGPIPDKVLKAIGRA